ncbi:MAG: glycosyltransferase [Patescibacteria group bacterium]
MNPLVSVIIPTKNSSKYLHQCLDSIENQTYRDLEIIVVDNNSNDDTKDIAKKYTGKVFNHGPERSAQRNYGVNNSNGDFVLIIDSDMELSCGVIETCVKKITLNSAVLGLIIPEESFGQGFWAECKKLEKSFYLGLSWMEAARFFQRSVYLKVGGYNEALVSGEDWDLSQRIEAVGSIGRIDELIYHNEGDARLAQTIKKKYYYAGEFAKYVNSAQNRYNVAKQTGVMGRYKLFFSNPKKLFRNPVLGAGMIFMKTCEFWFGGIGYIAEKIKKI